MNITLAIDSRTVERARKAAESMGKSLNQAVRDYLEELAGLAGDVEQDVTELERLSAESGGRSGGRRIGRDELHERP
jgi:hypothetical protein